jgi:hypothetical protein
MELHRPARPLVQAKLGCHHTDLTRHEGNDLVRQLGPAARKPAMPAVELQQQCEAQPRRATLTGDQVLLVCQQRPALNQLINLN